MELSKLFEQTSDVVLTKAEISAMKSKYEKLDAMAKVGKAYRESLRREAVKLAALARPSMDASVVEGVVKKLDVNELIEFTKAFGEIAAKEYPIGEGAVIQLGKAASISVPDDEQFII